MKFNILDYSQRIAISMGLDLPDLHILGWIQDFWPEMKKKIIDGEEYGWIQYGYFIRDMPIVKIETADGLYRRLKKLEKKGLLKHKGVKNESGSFSYYKITEKIIELLKDKPLRGGTDLNPDGGTDGKSDGTDQKPDGTDGKSDRVGIKSRTKDNPSSNPSTISFLSLPPEEKKEFIEKIFLDKKLKSDPETYFLFREKNNWKGVANLEADIAWWENGHKKKHPELHVEKTETKPKKIEPKEILELRNDIKGEICRDNEEGYLDHKNIFAGKPIEKTLSGYKIIVEDERALRYEEVLKQIKVEIEKV